eukprot:9481215-Pyramimonas_sp.AAC.1
MPASSLLSHQAPALSERRLAHLRGRPGESQGIFSVAGVLLVAHREYSQSLTFYWSHTSGIFSAVSQCSTPGLSRSPCRASMCPSSTASSAPVRVASPD